MTACSVRVYGGSFTGHMCSRNAKVERKGKWYCGIHDPEYVAKKNEEKRARWYVEDALRSKEWQRKEGIAALGKLTLDRLRAGFADNDRDAEIEIAKKHGLLP